MPARETIAVDTLNDVVKRAWEPEADEDVEINFAVWGLFRCWEVNAFPLKDGSTSFVIREWETDGNDTKVRLLSSETELTSPGAAGAIARALAACALNIDRDVAQETFMRFSDETSGACKEGE